MKDISDLMIKVGELSIDEYLSGKKMYLVTVELPVEHCNLLLLQLKDEDLAKLHRNLIISESYESIAPVEEELKRRGYTITIEENFINYKP